MDLLSVILVLISGTLVSCSEYVPVLVWSTQTTEDSYPVIPALSRLTSNEFTDYLLKRVKVENPVILLFVEENLSVEDFSWKDVNGNGAFPMLRNITRTADDVAFIPSVHEPYKALKKLKNHGYNWRFYEKENFETLKDGKNAIFEVKLEDPDYLEDRPDMLKRHDEKMAKIYKEALSYKSNVMVIYTGSHTSWIDTELGRFKREDEGTNGSSTLIIKDSKNLVRIATTPPIVFKKKEGDKDVVININKVLGDPTTKESKDELILRVRFELQASEVWCTKTDIRILSISVDFKFSSQPQEWWTLSSVDIADIKEVNLIPSVDVGGPSGYSFYCNPSVSLSNKKVSLTFENFQVQPRVGEGNNFGPVIHCINFFSVGILSGLVIVFILSVVLAWGITMIMDINTNDRFDDPKGKTITITATD